MKTFKKLLAVLIALMLVAGVCACGENPATGSNQEKETQNTTELITETTIAAAESDYQVTVVDENGNPISGVLLQMCHETCVPGKTNENGVAEFSLKKADYKVSLLNMPEGFAYATDETEWYFATGQTTMTIVLKTVG